MYVEMNPVIFCSIWALEVMRALSEHYRHGPCLHTNRKKRNTIEI